MDMRFVSMFAAATLALTLLGCGQRTEEAAPATETATATDTAPAATTETTAAANPCSWVTAEDVTAIMGMTLAAHAGDTENDCSFRSSDEKVKMIVKIVDAAGYAAMAGSKGAESVAGLGEKASWIPWVGSLLVVKGEKMLDVAYDESVELTTRATESDKKQRATALAEKLIGNL
jgi:hypothetical protein